MTESAGPTGIAPDEKLCPFCAETIKRAAIRCRYCQSDLEVADSAPPSEPELEPEPASRTEPASTAEASTEPELEPEPEPVAVPSEPSTSPTTTRAAVASGTRSVVHGRRLMIGLLVLCLVLVGIAAFAWVRYERAEDKADDQLAAAQARASGLAAASTLTQKVLSYDWQTLDEDTKAAEAVLAPSFRKEYAKTIAGVRAQTVKNQVKLTAQVASASVVSVRESKVVALVFVNQVTTAKGTTNQRLDQNRVLVTLTRGGGDWRVSKMDAF